MTSRVIDGKAYARELGEKISASLPVFRSQAGCSPGLAVVLVGNDPGSEVYVAAEGKMARKLGRDSFEHVLPEETCQCEFLALIDTLNKVQLSTAFSSSFPCPDILIPWMIQTPLNPV